MLSDNVRWLLVGVMLAYLLWVGLDDLLQL
jgi:hypothetical protein